jgi:hypothetical protein
LVAVALIVVAAFIERSGQPNITINPPAIEVQPPIIENIIIVPTPVIESTVEIPPSGS